MKGLRYLAGPALLLAVTGCASFSGQPQQPYEDKRINGIETMLEDLTSEKACNDMACRNQMIFSWLEAVDYYYHAFEDQVGATGRGFDFATDVGTAATTAGATAVVGNHTKTVLSAIATFFGGTKTAFDTGLYGQQSIQVLKARMRALRQAVLVKITQGQHEPIESYTMVDAKMDLNAYFEAGSLDAAIEDIQKDSGDKKNQSSDQIQQLRFGFDDNSKAVIGFWKPGNKEDKDRYQALTDWVEINAPETRLPALINSAEYSDDRKKLVAFINSYGPDDDTKKLRELWKPGGKASADKRSGIEAYITAHVTTKPDLATFLYSKSYEDQRKDAVTSLNK